MWAGRFPADLPEESRRAHPAAKKTDHRSIAPAALEKEREGPSANLDELFCAPSAPAVPTSRPVKWQAKARTHQGRAAGSSHAFPNPFKEPHGRGGSASFLFSTPLTGPTVSSSFLLVFFFLLFLSFFFSFLFSFFSWGQNRTSRRNASVHLNPPVRDHVPPRSPPWLERPRDPREG